MSKYFRNSFPELRKTVASARKSTFWAKKLSVEEIRNVSDFRKLPITRRNEINALYDAGRWQELLTSKKRKRCIIATSGGRPYRSPFVSCYDKQEFEEVVSTITDMFIKNSVNQEKV